MPIKEGDLICKQYEVLEVLGDGCYARVYLVMDTKDDDSQVYAMKAIHKRHLKKNPELGPNLYRETQIHKTLDHPNIIKFYDEIDDDFYIYFILELVSPGELFKELYRKHDDLSDDSDDSSEDHHHRRHKHEGFSEGETRHYIKQLISALMYLRDRKVIHRDLKPENLLVNQDGVLKLADFGWATDRRSKSIVGTDTYNAPEMIKRRMYDYRSDIWSMGIIFYEFLYQKRPYKGRNEKETEKLILRNKLKFPSEPRISSECKDLIKKILTLDPDERPDYEEILAHPWMTVNQRKSSDSQEKLDFDSQEIKFKNGEGVRKLNLSTGQIKFSSSSGRPNQF